MAVSGDLTFRASFFTRPTIVTAKSSKIKGQCFVEQGNQWFNLWGGSKPGDVSGMIALSTANHFNVNKGDCSHS